MADKSVVVESPKSVDVCPFNGLPCDFVSSCDDVMERNFGLPPSYKCQRVVWKVARKK